VSIANRPSTHCEERLRRSNPVFLVEPLSWIAALAMTLRDLRKRQSPSLRGALATKQSSFARVILNCFASAPLQS
jgi:hypothetical protein